MISRYLRHLLILTLLISTTACSTLQKVQRLEVFSTPVERAPIPMQPPPAPVKLRSVEWYVVTVDTYDDFKEAFKEEAMKIQGSGWIYLSTNGDIKTIKNHAVRTDICVLVDWWEHAWALDYQSDKEKYLDNIWKIINWDVCNERL